jgi:hypothetical protein
MPAFLHVFPRGRDYTIQINDDEDAARLVTELRYFKQDSLLLI